MRKNDADLPFAYLPFVIMTLVITHLYTN